MARNYRLLATQIVECKLMKINLQHHPTKKRKEFNFFRKGSNGFLFNSNKIMIFVRDQGPRQPLTERQQETTMRKLIYAINLTLDGCCDHTKGIADEELHEFYAQLLRETDTFVYGRKTYELMVPFWPDIAKSIHGTTNAMSNFAQAFEAVSKIVVFSRSLNSVPQAKASIVRSGLREEIMKLKSQDGKDILTGGVDIPSQLIALDLIDEYYVVYHPVIAGEGRRLLDTTSFEQKKLELVNSRMFASGSIALHYRTPV